MLGGLMTRTWSTEQEEVTETNEEKRPRKTNIALKTVRHRDWKHASGDEGKKKKVSKNEEEYP